MRTLLVIMGIVVILALVSLPGAAMISEADLIASYLPDQENMDRMSSMFFCGDCGSESPYVLPEGTGIFVRPEPYDPLISKDDLIASYTNLPDQGTYDYADDLSGCGDCTPQPWSKGTVTPTPTPTPHTHPPPDYLPSSGSVPLNISPCIRGVCPEPLPVTPYKVTFPMLFF